MDEKRKPGYYAVIPAQVRYDESLRPNAKLLYGELTALAGPDGYCWATNQYFADLYGLAVSTVSELIKSLADRGYIKIEMSSNNKGAERHIYAGSFMVFAAGEGSSQKSEDPPGEGLPKNRKMGLPKNQKGINDNNINNINTPLPPTLKGVKFLSEPLLKRLVDYAGRDEQLLTALLAHAEMRYKLKRPIVTDRTLTLLLNKLEKLADGNRRIKLANSNKKTYNEYLESVRKGSLGIGGSGGTSLSSMAKGLATGQVGQMVAASLGEYLNYGLSSAIGVPEASMISSTLSSAISGVAAGAIAGLPGMIIGGLVGAGSGMLSGYTEIQESKDDAFKEYYAGLYEDINAATEEMLSAGTVTSGSREQTLLAFAKRLGGQPAAERYLAQIQSFAGETNYDYDEITGYSKLLMNSYDPSAVFGVLKSLSDATAGLSLSDSDVETMISGLNRMRTTGKATTEYLNFFSERGVDVYSALSEALGVDKSSIAEMVSGGEITGEFASQAILNYIDSTFGGLSEELMGTYDAMSNNLEDIMTSIDAAGGEGYNDMRKEGLEADIEAFGGALGEAMAEMNRIYGENAAYLENLSGQYQREALSAVLMGGETTLFSDEDQGKLEEMRAAYIEAKEAYENGDQAAGIRMQQEVENAEALATAAYESSDAAIALRDAELDQIAAIRDNTAGLEAASTAYLQAMEMSKGMGAVVIINGGGDSEIDVEGIEDSSYVRDYVNEVVGTETYTSSYLKDYTDNAFRNAYGLERVPYDNFPALLDEDEQVLTAAEARSRKEPRVINISVTGNNFSGTDSDMADRVAETIVRKLEQAAFVAAPR